MPTASALHLARSRVCGAFVLSSSTLLLRRGAVCAVSAKPLHFTRNTARRSTQSTRPHRACLTTMAAPAPPPRPMPFATVDAGEAAVSSRTRHRPHFADPSTVATATPIDCVASDAWESWLSAQDSAVQRWIFNRKCGAKKPSCGEVLLVPVFSGSDAGSVRPVVVGLAPGDGFIWAAAAVYGALPTGVYAVKRLPEGCSASHFEIGWALGAYKFDVYKSKGNGNGEAKIPPTSLARLCSGADAKRVDDTLNAIYMVRDLISTPAECLGPANLAAAAKALAKLYPGALCDVVVGDQLLEPETYYPQVHCVGRAATEERAPRLIDLRWNWDESNIAREKIVLVGKGVVYDTGGLSIKGTAGMVSMKKDMGGGAHVLGLASMIMAAGCNVGLRVLVPAVENSVSSNSFRPGDIIVARNGTTSEVCLCYEPSKLHNRCIQFAVLSSSLQPVHFHSLWLRSQILTPRVDSFSRTHSWRRASRNHRW
jgi:Cytosol aminopeptidase family, catalytic domain